MLALRATCRRPSVLVHEGINVDVSLVNEGAAPARAPDPGASMKAPRLRIAPVDRPEEVLRVLTPADLAARLNPGVLAGNEEPDPITLAPGEARRTSVDPVAWGGAIPAGRWTITVEVPLEEVLLSASVLVEVRPLAGEAVTLAPRDGTGRGDRVWLAWSDGRPLLRGHAIAHPHGRSPAPDQLVAAGRSATSAVAATTAPGDGSEDDRLVAFTHPGGLEVVHVTALGAVAASARLELEGARVVAVEQAKAHRTIVHRGLGSASVTELPGRVLAACPGELVGVEVLRDTARIVARVATEATRVRAVPVSGATLVCGTTARELVGWRWSDAFAPLGSVALEGVLDLALVADPPQAVDEDAVSSAILLGEPPPAPPPPPRSAHACVLLPDPEHREAVLVARVRIGPDDVHLLGTERVTFESRPIAPRVFACAGAFAVLDRRPDGSLAVAEPGRPVVYVAGEHDDLYAGVAFARADVPLVLRLTRREGLVVSDLA